MAPMKSSRWATRPPCSSLGDKREVVNNNRLKAAYTDPEVEVLTQVPPRRGRPPRGGTASHPPGDPSQPPPPPPTHPPHPPPAPDPSEVLFLPRTPSQLQNPPADLSGSNNSRPGSGQSPRLQGGISVRVGDTGASPPKLSSERYDSDLNLHMRCDAFLTTQPEKP